MAPNAQLLYGPDLQQRGELATLTFEHFGDYRALEHFGFADLSNDVSLKSPDLYLEWYPKPEPCQWAEHQAGACERCVAGRRHQRVVWWP